MTHMFEMSASGQLHQTTVVECGVCWWTYDPVAGDMDNDLIPGVGFADLPESFRCPCCDAPKHKFMIKPDSVGADSVNMFAPVSPAASAHQAPVKVSMTSRLDALRQAYAKVEDAMVGLPVHNPKLMVEMVSFQETAEGYVGAVITPWSLNIAILPTVPTDQPMGAIGSHRDVAFPSGNYPFLSAHLDGFGALETCSLISPMEDFDDQKIVRMTAEAALEGLFTAPERPKHSRRAMFTGRATAPQEPPGELFLK